MEPLPHVTLFMLMSIDGKISTGAVDQRDFDQDLPLVESVSAGLHQYYDLEKQTDLFSMNSGRVLAKVGWNEEKRDIVRLPVTFVVIDNRPHLTSLGINNLLRRSEKVIVATINPNHPASNLKDDRLDVVSYDEFQGLFRLLKRKGADRITLQTGGEMNAVLFREDLIHELSIVVVPLIVGGRSTPTLVDGKSLETIEDLKRIVTLRLIDAKPLADSYLHIRYEVESSRS